MMNFEIVESKIKTILNADAVAGEFTVIGYPNKEKSADNVNKQRHVNCFYSAGDFSSSSGGHNSDNKQHVATYAIELYVASKSTDETTGFEESGLRANKEMNDLISTVYQILMRGENLFLQTEDANGLNNVVSSREIKSVQKTPLEEKGQYAVLSAVMNLTAQMVETVTGVIGVTLEDVDAILSLDGDTVAQQGTTNDYTP